MIEKHFTLDKSDTTIRDHALSATPDEFAQLVYIGRQISKTVDLGFDVTGRLMILSSDTSHHRAFITKLHAMGVIFDTAIFENTSVTADFDITNPFEDEQQNFENDMWSGWLSLDGMNVSEVENINSTDSVRKIKENKPDCAVVFGTRKLKPEVINSSLKAC